MQDIANLQTLIKKELINWATGVLSKKTDFYSNNPPCPFAQSALQLGFADVKYGFGPYMSNVMQTISNYPKEMSMVIHAQIDPKFTAKELKEWTKLHNREVCKNDLWLISFHPEDDPNENMEDDKDFEELVEEDYALVFVQNLTELNDASKVLELKGYYDKLPAEDLAELKIRRKASEDLIMAMGRKGAMKKKRGTGTKDKAFKKVMPGKAKSRRGRRR
tara:strand:- start:998 stop:1654 length:657 start_codon:yes stop_codon:yes gene_type:complete